MAPRYKLKLSKLDFISIVDEPAQPNAKCLLIKRAGKNDRISATARLVKTSDELGLAFFWAFTSTNADGSDHHDLQGDAIAADDAMVKACAEFMERGGPADQQHDSSTIGKTVFAMPMTPQIASAFGVVTKTTGLMIAIRPSKEVLAKLKDGSYSGVSIAGLGERTPVEKRRAKVRKDVVLTSLEDGHQHTVDLEDPLCGYSDSLSTSYQTAEGADNGHSHAWIFDATTGAVTIAADSGHTHTVSDAVPAAVLTAAAAIDAQEDARIAAVPTAIAAEPSDGIPCAVEAEQSSGANVNVTIVQARSPLAPTTIAPAAQAAIDKSPRAAVVHEPVRMNDADRIKQLETDNTTLSKRADRAEAVSKLNDAQRAHLATLTGSDADGFLAKSDIERAAIVKSIADADTIEHTAEDGTVYRKSAGAQVIALAKSLTEANKIAKAERDARAVVEIEKKAAEILPHVGKVEAVRLYKAAASITDAAERDAAIVTLKALDNARAMLGVTKGVSEGELVAVTKSSAYAALEKGLTAFCKEKGIAKVWTDGLDAFAQTDAGAVLTNAYSAFTAAQ